MHVCAYTGPVSFEWDPDKAETNRKKHGVDFADAALVLYDDFALTTCDIERGEERFVTLGLDPLGRLLVVVYAWRGDNIRIMSARLATRAEARRYGNMK
jgi:uncharacterized protein